MAGSSGPCGQRPLGLHWVSPFFTAVSAFPIQAAHLVERHGLIVLIALGESIIAVGIGMPAHELRAGRAVTAALGLGLAAALWWLYFGGEDERAERVLRAAAADRTSWLALYAFGYAFLPVLGGIIMFAAGMKNAVVQYGEPAAASSQRGSAARVRRLEGGATVRLHPLRRQVFDTRLSRHSNREDPNDPVQRAGSP